ncbi:hypothetical protein CBR_g29611 [Chara braunii]|uniref:Uncharacterized protein n=1 Tax=Chara braunii TaxID=69332 RepID=A0A388LAW6_CHABU|nr:hypothetical protein CBR_g29611 [Chara braunii]|eukprot:GBG79465.1 hypothetical protein CBR_g29611 [Chara braunii]
MLCTVDKVFQFVSGSGSLPKRSLLQLEEFAYQGDGGTPPAGVGIGIIIIACTVGLGILLFFIGLRTENGGMFCLMAILITLVVFLVLFASPRKSSRKPNIYGIKGYDKSAVFRGVFTFIMVSGVISSIAGLLVSHVVPRSYARHLSEFLDIAALSYS